MPKRSCAGRPTKYSEEIAAAILNAIQAAIPKAAAFRAAKIDPQTFANWCDRYPAFAERVEAAEETAKAHLIARINKAASGFDVEIVTETTRTEVKTRKTRHPDGTVVEEPVTIEMKTREVRRTAEFDWRAAESLLKRRWPAEFGDRQDVTSMGQQLGMVGYEVVLPDADDRDGDGNSDSAA